MIRRLARCIRDAKMADSTPKPRLISAQITSWMERVMTMCMSPRVTP